MRDESLLTSEELKKWLRYSPESGDFVWIRRKFGVTLGKVAGAIEQQGYRVIKLNGYFYKAHRLAFLYMTGEFPPKGGVDHANGDRSDNRWENLRLATSSQNQGNKKNQKNNSSGFKGVTLKKGHGVKKWCARIQVEKKPIHLGYFETPEEAHEVYCDAAKRFFGEFSHDGEKPILTNSEN